MRDGSVFYLRTVTDRGNVFGVIGADEDLVDDSYNRCIGGVASGSLEVVLEGLLEHVADLALAHRAHHVEGLGGDYARSCLLLNQQVAHLGPVPVGDGDPFPLALPPDEPDDLLACNSDVRQLLGCGSLLGPPLDGVAPEGD